MRSVCVLRVVKTRCQRGQLSCSVFQRLAFGPDLLTCAEFSRVLFSVPDFTVALCVVVLVLESFQLSAFRPEPPWPCFKLPVSCLGRVEGWFVHLNYQPPCLAPTFEESELLVIVARKVRIRACYSVRVSMTFRVVRTYQYNQDLGLIHLTNGNHLESPNEGSSIDHQVTIHLHAQNITMFPTNETWYFASQMLVSSSGVLILILTVQSTRNKFRIHSDY
ncbi:hypothetical protein F511_33092 [Dorcoceras hygrometricum]|uniref:Uncharacterized protein n=1 Tax=Dorcoceras hygrometricum TaxID=472368 RepID=A0A2Z7DH80_9LAMI|nr:hypothetical protein F511_33092 [Dorcoceras hygrometricum]